MNNGNGIGTTTTLQGKANCYDYILDIEEVPVQYSEAEKEIFKLDSCTGEIISNNYSEWILNKYNYNLDNKINSKYGNLTGWLKRISASSLYSLKEYLNKPDYVIKMEKKNLLRRVM